MWKVRKCYLLWAQKSLKCWISIKYSCFFSYIHKSLTQFNICRTELLNYYNTVWPNWAGTVIWRGFFSPIFFFSGKSNCKFSVSVGRFLSRYLLTCIFRFQSKNLMQSLFQIYWMLNMYKSYSVNLIWILYFPFEHS